MKDQKDEMNNAVFPYYINNGEGLSGFTDYLRAVKDAQKKFEEQVSPILEKYLQECQTYNEAVEQKKLNIDYRNPMIHTQKSEYLLYMLLIEYSNLFMRAAFEATPTKVVVLPRCLTGPNYDLLKVKRSKIGWHRIVGSNTDEYSPALKLSHLGDTNGFHTYITMGKRFKEPSFSRVFKNLQKKLGNFGLIAVACLPELALGKTYIMEAGIPAQAVPLLYPGCSKWHDPIHTLATTFSLEYVLKLLKLPADLA
ncbi:MAG: hypothetical protein ACFFE8_07590 [Candidatus Heimdallarchaeota archaeon]